MSLESQKKLAKRVLKCGKNRIHFDPARTEDISNAITSNDIKNLVNEGVIKKVQKKGISSYRSKKIKTQKKKGRRKNSGSRKGKLGTRISKKREWINRIRSLRRFLRELKENKIIDVKTYRSFYMKCKGGYFRGKKHMIIFMERNEILDNEKLEKAEKMIKK